METTTTCANCGKGEEESNNLKSCVACQMVKYCNRDCQIAHRPQHKRECKKRAAEIYDEKLFKEVEREECPICITPLPIDANLSIFHSCCGNNICFGCIYAMKMSEGGADLCAFCRTPTQRSEEEELKRVHKLMERGNAVAFYQLGGYYDRGVFGLTQDYQKATELYLKAGELGYAGGYHNLACSYSNGTGVEIDKKKAKRYYELATMGGDIMARHNLAGLEGKDGNHSRGMKHLILAARAGHELSFDMVKRGFMKGLVAKDEYENILSVYHERQKEMKSNMRDKAMASGIFDRD